MLFISHKMAGALCAFARTGSPSQAGLVWEPWTSEGDAMMVFDHDTQLRCHHEDALFEALGTASAGMPF